MTPEDQFGLYIHRAHQLEETRLVRSGSLSASMNWKWDRNFGLQATVSNPDEDDLRSFLTIFRMFVSNDEPTFIDKIYNQCFLRLRSQELKDELVEAKAHWKDVLKGAGVRIAFDERHMTPAHFLDLWINGEYFHSSPQKRAELLRLAPEQMILARWSFLNHLVEATRQVMFYATIITIGLRDGHFDLE